MTADDTDGGESARRLNSCPSNANFAAGRRAIGASDLAHGERPRGSPILHMWPWPWLKQGKARRPLRISSHDPSSRSSVFRVGIIWAVTDRECAATMTSTGNNTAVPSSSGIFRGGNHRSISLQTCRCTTRDGSGRPGERIAGRSARSARHCRRAPSTFGRTSPEPSTSSRSARSTGGRCSQPTSCAPTRCSAG
jgi:hypothetical protein